jgi:hypothetical protein
MLFSDCQDKDGKDRCLAAECWEIKLNAFLANTERKLKDKHPDLIFIAGKGCSEYEAPEQYRGRGVRSGYGITFVKKTDKNAQPAMVVCGNNPGELVYIKKERSLPSDRGEQENGGGGTKTIEQRRAGLDSKRWGQVITELREKLAATVFEDIVGEDKTLLVTKIAAAFGVDIDGYRRTNEKWELVDNDDSQKNVLVRLWSMCIDSLDSVLFYNGPVTQMPAEFVDSARRIAKIINADIDKMFEEVSQQKGFTEPKSWS